LVLAFGINNHIGLPGHVAWKTTGDRPSIVPAEGQPMSPRGAAVNNMGKVVGDEMMTRFVVPFELAGLLLTAALVGAIALAHREGDGDESPRLGGRAASVRGALEETQNGRAGNGRPSSDALTPSAR
jgi:NADH-quinone oxidoreductase subunit J